MFERTAPACRGARFQVKAIALALGLLAIGAGIVRAEQSRVGLDPVREATTPPFKLEDLANRQVSLAAQRGQVVLVHFFATWCEPCRDELARLNRLVQRADPQTFHVLAISVAEVDVRVRNFVEKAPVDFPILLDRDRSVARSWNVSALPTTFILDRNLRPRLFVERDYDWDRLDLAELVSAFSANSGSAAGQFFPDTPRAERK